MVLIMIVALIAQEPPTSRNLADSAAADAPAAEAASTPAAAGAAAAEAASTPAAADAAVAEAAPTSAAADVAVAEAAAEAASSEEANAARDDEEDFGTRTVQVHPKCSLQFFDPDERKEVLIRWQQLCEYEDSQGRVWPCEMVAKQPEHTAVVLRDLETKKQMYHIPNGTLVKVVGERDDSFVIVTDTYSDHRNRLVREGEVTGIAKKYNFVGAWGDW
jgi:nucleoid-associated protein YgaU